eukprot:TRINITY_DN15921_c0_g1_i1.p1 TRINITY_DN15921_c0_g1~~TRINITY_DN15921_c0_g1_i1.p1  ORF type:complete len:237 (+),score=29.07 TRINITY_DN15921_c0_g1_i1:135-845(+)
MRAVVPAAERADEENRPGDDPVEIKEAYSPIRAMGVVLLLIVITIALGAGIWLMLGSDSDSTSATVAPEPEPPLWTVSIRSSEETSIPSDTLPEDCHPLCYLTCNQTSNCFWDCGLEGIKPTLNYTFTTLYGTDGISDYLHCMCNATASWTCYTNSKKSPTVLPSRYSHLVPNSNLQMNCDSTCVLVRSGLDFKKSWFCEGTILYSTAAVNSTEDEEFNNLMSVGDLSFCENVASA